MILGQSLGTAVSSAVVDHFASIGTNFAGVVLIAPFTDLPNLLTTYSIGGWIPILSPLRRTPALQRIFSRYVVDKWPTLDRLKHFVLVSHSARLYLLHAFDDFEIPYQHSETLWTQIVNSTLEDGAGVDIEAMELVNQRSTIWKSSGSNSLGQDAEIARGHRIDPRDKEGYARTWHIGQGKSIREEIVNTGG